MAQDPAEDPPVPSHYVRLDVGGTRYTTLLSTLRKHPGSMLATMFEGLHGEVEGQRTIGLAMDSEGSYILDRDGPLFRHVLNYLRHEGDGEPPLPLGEEDRWLLATEADYYMLPELAQECRAGCGRAGPLDMSGSVLAGRDFRGRDLRGANLSGSDLSNADFSQADLTDTNLSRCDVSGAIFSGATMRQPRTMLDGMKHEMSIGRGPHSLPSHLSEGEGADWLEEGMRVLYRTHPYLHEPIWTGTIVSIERKKPNEAEDKVAICRDKDGATCEKIDRSCVLVPLAAEEECSESNSKSE
jgi:hypothetical protein